jgi:predicted nucleic-acid-binding protein
MTKDEAPAYLVDTNVLLRFLTNDHKTHSPAARQLIEGATEGKLELRIPLIAIAETVFTLQAFYEIERKPLGTELLKILNAPGVTLACPDWVLDAVEIYRTRNVSFGDACLAAHAISAALAVASFDQGLSKFDGLNRFEPGSGKSK